MSAISSKDLPEKEIESHSKAVLRRELEMMHREMEIASYATNQKGQSVRATPKSISLERTLKRKTLERDDAKARAIEVSAEERKLLDKSRLRGARAALTLGQGTNEPSEMIFMGRTTFDQYKSDSSSSSHTEDASIEEEEEEEDIEVLNAEEVLDYNDEELLDDDLESSQILREENLTRRPEKKSKFSVCDDDAQKQTMCKIKRKKGAVSGSKLARTMYRLKNFSSQKLAEKHGDALGAHARGQYQQAIAKLSEVASAAPIAPQLYSSLGLMYENMLEESEQELYRRKKLESSNTISAAELMAIVKLGEKGYGSYHVAAVLCKKDFTLWVRAGDAAWDIADLYHKASRDPTIPNSTNSSYRSEELKWLTEAKEDYEAADKLKPPGITVPAKLASIQMKLGNFAEALTILTDLRNSSFRLSLAASKRCRIEGGMRPRTELEKSYTAWLLYADLMLRIGYECTRWNSRCSNIENYMFKRWLKKHSSTFNWKERRFYALCCALEAAVGSVCCQKLVSWLKERANRQPENVEEARWKIDNYEANDEDEIDEGEIVNENNLDAENLSSVCENGLDQNKNIMKNGCSSDKNPESDTDFLVKKKKLLDNNRIELQEFDLQTLEMSLDSDAMVARKKERDLLIKRHRHAVVCFVGDHQMRKSDNDSTPESPLPLSASCGVVCDITSQLIRISLDMNFFKVGQLAAEATSSYLMQRYLRRQKRKRSLEKCKKWITATEIDILQINEKGHDETDYEFFSDDDTILSDEEDIDSSDDGALLLSLKNGVLPPDLRFLYALSLLGEGTSKDAALRMLSSVNDLDSEASVTTENTDFAPDRSWVLFERSAKEKLKRSAALILLLELLRSTKQEQSYAEQILPLFENETLISIPVLVEDDSTERNAKTRASLFAAISRLKLYAAIATSKSMGLTESIEAVLSIINKIERSHKALWFGACYDNGPNHTTVLMIEIFSKAFSFISKLLLESNWRLLNTNILERVTKTMNNLVRIICGLQLPCNASFIANVPRDFSETWSTFPCPSDWQDTTMSHLSKRCFLLCAGMNVVQFSGWGDEEFNLETLTSRCSFGFFGVNVFGAQMAGHLHPCSEELLSLLWTAVPNVLINVPHLNFADHLDKVKASSWYSETFEKFHDLTNGSLIATLGEDWGLNLLLSLAAVNLLNAYVETSPAQKDEFVKTAMSVIFPVTQFCLNINIWDSSLGRGASRETADAWDYYLKERNNLDEVAPHNPVTSKARAKPVYTSVTTAALKNVTGSSRGIILPQTWRPTRPSIIPVPVSLLLQEWKTLPYTGEHDLTLTPNDSLLPSRVSMKKVDFAMKQLRSSLTIQALQKSCIKVAEALLEVAADPLCHNPFLCLSHAAIFASYGPKGGNSDEPFKRRLPVSKKLCTPMQALLILGRADCLRAVAFTDEAIFLCSYVAKLVALHRSQATLEWEWNAQWRVVGIQTYLVYASIDVSIKPLLTAESSSSLWEDGVNQEITHSKIDAQNISGLTLTHIEEVPGRHQASDNQFLEDTEGSQQNGETDYSDYLNIKDEQQILLTEALPPFISASFDIFDGHSDNESQVKIEAV